MKILLLGGTSDAIRLAKQLIMLNIDLTYSIAGLVRQPSLNCKIHKGGFQGKLSQYLKEHQFDLLLDATHPYAAKMSRQAIQASQNTNTACWQYIRPAWHEQQEDNWIAFHNWNNLRPKILNYHRPFFALGQEPLKHIHTIPKHQHWTIRTAIQRYIKHPQLTIITAIGGFSLDEELALFEQQQFDVLICKNSGGDTVVNKLAAAKQHKLPVMMQSRLAQIEATKTFSSIDKMVYKIRGLPQK